MTVLDKLVSIPIGLANEKWPHGDENIFIEVLEKKMPKELVRRSEWRRRQQK